MYIGSGLPTVASIYVSSVTESAAALGPVSGAVNAGASQLRSNRLGDAAGQPSRLDSAAVGALAREQPLDMDGRRSIDPGGATTTSSISGSQPFS